MCGQTVELTISNLCSRYNECLLLAEIHTNKLTDIGGRDGVVVTHLVVNVVQIKNYYHILCAEPQRNPVSVIIICH